MVSGVFHHFRDLVTDSLLSQDPVHPPEQRHPLCKSRHFPTTLPG